jgi:uncharacterized protein (DUF2062 family)
MPREILRKLGNWAHARRGHWSMRMFGDRIAERHLWSLNRRAVCAGFGAGIAIAFVPLPVHTIVAILVAIIWRLNLPMTIAATWLINPLTLVPGYYLAYRLGAWMLREPPRRFAFEFSWRWLEHGLGPRWAAFLLGCLVCAGVGGVLGRLLLDRIWRYALMKKYRLRLARRTSS